MNFCLITNADHKIHMGKYYAYGPYVREMNLWLKHIDKLTIIAPLSKIKPLKANSIYYKKNEIQFIPIPDFNLKSTLAIFASFSAIVKIFFVCIAAMKKADHIHLRCPGNVGLIGSVAQIFYPKKKKTAKYAGNWDWKSNQPWSYRLQQLILRNTFLTRNMTVLVYGDWPDKTKNIKPFFTASYSEEDRIEIKKTDINVKVKLAFIGTLTPNKSPITSLLVLKILKEKGINTILTFCGDGPEIEQLISKTNEWGLEKNVEFLGNVSAEKVKDVLKQAHFLVFISKSEGWPKAVAEAMWWGCIPITTPVSCVPQMLDNGKRGFLVQNNPEEISDIIIKQNQVPENIAIMQKKAVIWAREYTLEKFEFQISKLLNR